MERAALLDKFGSAFEGKESLLNLGKSLLPPSQDATSKLTRNRSHAALSLLKLHQLTADALWDHWEAYVLARLAGPPAGIVFNEENLSELGRGIKEKLKGKEKVLGETVKIRGAGMQKLNKGDMFVLSLSPPRSL